MSGFQVAGINPADHQNFRLTCAIRHGSTGAKPILLNCGGLLVVALENNLLGFRMSVGEGESCTAIMVGGYLVAGAIGRVKMEPAIVKCWWMFI